MNCKDCGTELAYMAAQSRGLCNPCDGKRRDAKKAKIRDDATRLDRVEEILVVLAKAELGIADPTEGQGHLTLRSFLEEVDA